MDLRTEAELREHRDLQKEILDRATELLPPWFAPAMLQSGYFELLTNTGRVLAVKRLSDVVAGVGGDVWIDLVWARQPYTYGSINAAHIAASFVLSG